MITFSRLLCCTAVITPLLVAPAQEPRDARLVALQPITPSLTDRGRVAELAAWSLTESPDARFIAFVSWDDTIRVYDRRTRALGKIPNAVVGASELNWSRRGAMISFARREETGQRVFPWIVPVDPATGRATAAARQISMQPTVRLDDAPSFSPDDRYVVFASNRGDSGFVLAAPSNGGRERVVTALPGSVSRAVLSPDGRWVYFSAIAPGPGSQRTLNRVPFSGGGAEQLANRVVFFIGVSADGAQLAWYADGHPRAAATSSIVIADATGKPLGVMRDVDAKIKGWSTKSGVMLGNKTDYTFGTRTVATAGGVIRSLGVQGPRETPRAWSPDGKLLLISSSAARSAWLVLAANGDTVRRIDAPPIAQVIEDDVPPAWSPDGRFVAYRAGSADGRRRASRLMLIEIATGQTRTLREIGQIGALRWRSDGQAVRYIDASNDALSLVETALSGSTTTLARDFTRHALAVPEPLTDSTVLVVSRDSVYVVSSRGTFIRSLRRLGLRSLAYMGNNIQTSPDGQSIAVIEDFPQAPAKHAIHLLPTDGGPSRTLEFNLDYGIHHPYFARDAIVFLAYPNDHAPARHSTDLFSVPLAGGVPRNLTVADSLTDVDFVMISLDGRSVAYQAEMGARTPTRVIEVDVNAATRRTPEGAK